jgi:hypothetical protein
MEDVVRELQRAIDLSEVEFNIINLKLSEFSKKKITSTHKFFYLKLITINY